MNKQGHFLVLILVLLIVIIAALGCTSCNSQSNVPQTTKCRSTISSNRPDLNLSVIIDLSDRISPTKSNMEKKDIGYLTSIMNIFTCHLMHKKTFFLNDNLKFYFLPNGAYSVDIQKLNRSITRHSTKSNVTQILGENIPIIENIYDARIIVGRDMTPKWGDGADIIGFLNDKASDLCIKKGEINKIIIISDGYNWENESDKTKDGKRNLLIPQNLKDYGLNVSEWEDVYENDNLGYIPLANELDAEILYIGLEKASDSPYSIDILKRYWTDFFNDKVISVKLFDNDIASNLDPIIENFILD